MTETFALPRELTPELIDILGMPNFRTVPIARAFRAAGRAEIRPRFEDEQSFVLHWLLGLYAEHGASWRLKASAIIEEVVAEAKARTAAADVAKGEASCPQS